MKKLGTEFYNRQDVVLIARELIGKMLVTCMNGIITSGIIVETEAYVGFTDKASHAYKGRRTMRNEHMYAAPGTAYVYICYGMHHLFNVVTNVANVPDAVLIRAVEPLQGIETMLVRRGQNSLNNTLTKGPGNVSKALGISKVHSGLNVGSDTIFISEENDSACFSWPITSIGSSKRIGVESAAEDALLPYRFYVKGNRFVSGYPNK